MYFFENWGNWKWSGGAIFSFLRAMTGPRVCGCCSLDIRQDMCVPECVFQTGKKWPFARVCSSPCGRALFLKKKNSENWEEPFFHLCRQLPDILEQLQRKVSAALSVPKFFFEKWFFVLHLNNDVILRLGCMKFTSIDSPWDVLQLCF